MDGAVGIIGTYVAAAVGTVALGLTGRWVDRKVTAMVQWRKGPPWYQPLADVLKLFYKETLLPSTARRTGFLIAPALALAAAVLAAAMLWSALAQPKVSFVGDLLVVLYLLMIPSIATMMGAAASGSPQAAVGASREMKLILSYELPFVLTLLVAVVHAGWTLRLNELAAQPPALYSFSGVLAMSLALLAAQAKLGQVPFDLAEAECEIMAGVYTEYSGPPLGLVYLARATLLAVMPLLLIAVFWGGLERDAWGVPFLGLAAFVGKYVLILVLFTLIRNTNPRLRIDQTVRLFWWVLTPLAAGAVVLALAGRKWGVSWL